VIPLRSSASIGSCGNGACYRFNFSLISVISVVYSVQEEKFSKV
jgi:hypothetical protein